jgi:predicted nucleic-acid-binding protein
LFRVEPLSRVRRRHCCPGPPLSPRLSPAPRSLAAHGCAAALIVETVRAYEDRCRDRLELGPLAQKKIGCTTPAVIDGVDELTEDEPGFVSMIVVAEIYWVLREAYKTDPGTVLTILRGLLDSKEIVVERSETARRALRRAEDGADFADSLIVEFGVDTAATIPSPSIRTPRRRPACS